MESTNTGAAQFTRESILNLRFPYKLWTLISTTNRVLSWGRDGTTILLDYAALNLYLSSVLSIFKSKTGYKFLRQLSVHGFERVQCTDENTEEPAESVILEFKHVNFIQNRIDLVKHIEQVGGLRMQNSERECNGSQENQNSGSQDPCLNKVRPLSAIERSRLYLRILLRMQSENYTLNKKLSDCERKSLSSTVSVIELPAEAFENPFDSISQFEENPDYAGYYGKASTDQIKQFFDEYLPIYAQENGEESVEKQTNQLSQKETPSKQIPSSSSFSYAVPDEPNEELPTDLPSNLSNFQIKYSVNLDPTNDDKKEYTLNILEEACTRIASDPPAPAAAVASYSDCDDLNGANARDEDISMDEYLKFKNSPEEGANGYGELLTATGVLKSEKDSNMAEDEKLDSPDVDSNENNFKNFFKQYRESINLLYE